MKKRLCVIGLCMVVLLGGCGIRNYQAERAGALFGKLFERNAEKKEQNPGSDEGVADEIQGETRMEGQDEIQGEDQGKNRIEGQDEIQGEGQDKTQKEGQDGIQGSDQNETSIEGQGQDAGQSDQGNNSSRQENNPAEPAAGTNKNAQNSVRDKEAERLTEDAISYQTKYVINCKVSITLRKSPSTSAAQLAEILWGEPVSFIQDDIDGFSKVAYQGKTGYVLAAYLGDTVPSARDSSHDTLRVVNCRESISLRKSPSVGAAEICQIPLGSIVSYVDSASNGFYKIRYMGRDGYALASYLEFYSAQNGMSAADGKKNTKNTEAVRVSFSYFINDMKECADIVGLNEQNEQVWKYEARSMHDATELESVQEIGVVGDAYYFCEDGAVVALAMSDGSVLWRNEDFRGASISFDTDEQGTLYICGYYGPDLCGIDRNGNTLFYVNALTPNFQWPYEIRYENRAVYIAGTAGGEYDLVVRYDLTTGAISY